MSRNAHNNKNGKFRKKLAKYLAKIQGGPLKSGDLVKFRHRFNKNSNLFNTCPMGPLESVDFHENGKNSDLTKNRQRLNKNSN